MARRDKNKNSPTEVQGQYSTKDIGNMRASYIKQSRSNDNKKNNERFDIWTKEPIAAVSWWGDGLGVVRLSHGGHLVRGLRRGSHLSWGLRCGSHISWGLRCGSHLSRGLRRGGHLVRRLRRGSHLVRGLRRGSHLSRGLRCGGHLAKRPTWREQALAWQALREQALK